MNYQGDPPRWDSMTPLARNCLENEYRRVKEHYVTRSMRVWRRINFSNKKEPGNQAWKEIRE